MPTLEHVQSSAEPAEVYGLLQRDGAVVVENILQPEQLRDRNHELDTLISATDPGLRHPAWYGQVSMLPLCGQRR